MGPSSHLTRDPNPPTTDTHDAPMSTQSGPAGCCRTEEADSMLSAVNTGCITAAFHTRQSGQVMDTVRHAHDILGSSPRLLPFYLEALSLSEALG